MSRAGFTPHDYRRTSRAGGGAHRWKAPRAGLRMEHSRDGQGHRVQSHDHQAASGKLLACSRIAARASNFLRIRCWCRKCAISWACTSIHRNTRWCCAWMKSRRFSAGSHGAIATDEARASRTAHATITSVMAPPRCLSALDVKSGKVIGQTYHRHRSLEFRKFLDRVDASVPPDQEAHIIMGQLQHAQNTAHPRVVRQTPTLHVHYTPTMVLG